MYNNQNNAVTNTTNSNVNTKLVNLLVKDWEQWKMANSYILKYTDVVSNLMSTDFRGNFEIIQEYKALMQDYRDMRDEAKKEYNTIWEMLNDSEKLLASLIMINKM